MINTNSLNPNIVAFPAWGVFLLSLGLFTLAFNSNEFIAFQSRFAMFAQEMLRYGLSFFPTTYGGIPYPDYPAGAVFIIWLFSQLLGGLTPFVAVLPTMITSSLILTLIYKIGVLHNQRLGFIAVAMTLLAIGFWQEARTITLDQYISLITVSTFYLLYRQKFYGQHSVWWIWILLWSIGFVIRGPIGIVVPCAVACSFYLLELRWRNLILTGLLGLGLIIVWWQLLLQAGISQGGAAFLNQILHMQVASRVDGFKISNFLSYYWRSLGNYALLYPFCVVVVIFSYKTWWNKNADPVLQLMRFSLLWAFMVLGGFSLASGKKSHYLLSMLPALGLFASCAWVTTFSDTRLERIRQIFNYVFRYLPLIVGLGLIIIWLYLRLFPIELFPVALPNSYFFACLALLTLFWLAPYVNNVDKNLYVAVFTLGITYVFIMEPFELYVNHTADFVHKLEEIRTAEKAQLGFYNIYPDALAIKYMVQLDQAPHAPLVSPEFFYDWALVTKSKTPLWLIIDSEEWDAALSAQQKSACQQIIQGRIGHNNIIACKILPY